MFRLIVVIAVLCTLAGCGGGSGVTDDYRPISSLAGHWVGTAGTSTLDITVADDGTFTGTLGGETCTGSIESGSMTFATPSAATGTIGGYQPNQLTGIVGEWDIDITRQ